MKLFSGYSKLTIGDSSVLLAGGGSKPISEFKIGDYLPLSGGTMTGDITFSSDNSIYWARNTDYARISFKNTGDGDSDSYMWFQTADNGDEYFRWSHSSGSDVEWMTLKSDGLRIKGTKVSLEGHTHAYLPLSGGSMSGDINMNNNSITNLKIGGGLYWNPYVESSSDNSDAAYIKVVSSGVAGGTTLVIGQENDASDTIQFVTNGSATLYHNSYPILTTSNYTSYCATTGHTHSYLPLSGGTMDTNAKIYCTSSSTDFYYGGAIEIREHNYVTSTLTAWGYAPGITFHWGGITVGKLGLRSDGYLAWADLPLLHSGNYSSYAVPLSGGTMTGSLQFNSTSTNHIQFQSSDYYSGGASEHMSIGYGRIQCWGQIYINGDTDGSQSEMVLITSGRGVSTSTADGLKIGYNSLTWLDNNILHTGNYTSYTNIYVPKLNNSYFYNFVGQSLYSGTGWYKITFPYVSTTSDYARWFMLSFDLVIGGSYASSPNAIIRLSYYMYSPPGSYANSPQNVYGTAIGSDLSGLRVCYNTSDGAILYIYTGNYYTTCAIKNLTALDSAPAYDYRNTIVEPCDSPSGITDISLLKVYRTSGGNYIDGRFTNNGGISISGTDGGPYLTVNYNSRYDSDSSLDNYGINLIKFGKSSMDNYLGTGLNTGYSRYFGRQSYVFHTGSSYAFGWYSSGWDNLMELSGGDGNLYTKGWVYSNYLHSRGDLYVQGTSYFGRNSYGDTYYINGPNYNGTSDNSNHLSIHGYGSSCFTYYQTSDSFDGNSGWCHYLIANHGDGASYYHFTLGLPFWDPPIYRRLTGSTSDVTQWYHFLTEENYKNYTLPITLTSEAQNSGDNNTWGMTYAESHRLSFIYNTSGEEWAYWIGMRSSDISYGTILRLSHAGRIQYAHKAGGGAGENWYGWKDVITLDNISSQSVNYANSAGSAINNLSLSGGTMTSGAHVVFPTSSTDWYYGGSFEFREYDYCVTNQSDWNYAPGITFHWGGRSVGKFGLRSDGQIAWADLPLVHSGNIGSQSVNYASGAGNADTVDSEHASAFAHIGLWNNLLCAGNEFNFISNGFSGGVWFNYQDGNRNNGGNVSAYYFGNGAGSYLAYISSGYFSGRSETVTINYNNDSNSTYQMLWGSGNSVYGTGGIYCNPYYDYLYATSFYTTSDINKKTNIKPLSTLLPLVEFNWKNSGRKSYGFIALDLRSKGFIELVDGEEGNMTVDYNAALSYFLSELSNIVMKNNEDLNMKISRLEAEIINLKTLLG